MTNRSNSYIVFYMNKTTDSKEKFYAKCKEADLKITPQRVIIYEVLADDKNHPSADAVFKKVREKIPNISFDTVNRTLLSFAEIGLLKVVEGYGCPKRFDTYTEGHHHFQCLECNKIVDFDSPNFDSLKIPEDIKNKFTITGKKVVLEGVCESCRK